MRANTQTRTAHTHTARETHLGRTSRTQARTHTKMKKMKKMQEEKRKKKDDDDTHNEKACGARKHTDTHRSYTHGERNTPRAHAHHQDEEDEKNMLEDEKTRR